MTIAQADRAPFACRGEQRLPDGLPWRMEPMANCHRYALLAGATMVHDHATESKGPAALWYGKRMSELQAEKPKQTHRPESWMGLIGAEQTDRQLTKDLRLSAQGGEIPDPS